MVERLTPKAGLAIITVGVIVIAILALVQSVLGAALLGTCFPRPGVER